MKINIYSVVALIYLAVAVTLAASDVGEVICEEAYPVPWHLPLQILLFLGAAILIGYCAGFISGLEEKE